MGVLGEQGFEDRVKIYATDADEEALDQARARCVLPRRRPYRQPDRFTTVVLTNTSLVDNADLVRRALERERNASERVGSAIELQRRAVDIQAEHAREHA